MSNLLKDASILLTPTGYDNGSMNAIKPSKDLYGSELVTSFTNGTSYPLDTFVSSGNNITSLIKSNGFGGCVSNGSSYTANDKVIVSFTYTKNSGDDLRVLFSSVVTGAGVSVSNIINISESGDYTLYFTILSTTTAYLQLGTGSGSASINGSITNVSAKKDLSGDFNFERNSAATRVNAQGLVENVQIISPELVSNGNFSQIGTEEVLNGNFSQEGSELITNGDFATDSDWTKLNSTISGGTGNLNGTGVTSMLWQDILTNGSTYKATFTISNYNAIGNSDIINSSGAPIYVINSNGTFTITFTHTDASESILFRARSGAAYSIDNVSVKEVGQNWELQNGWSIGNDVAVFSGTVSAYRTIYQQSILTIGKTYKLTFDIISISSGSIENISQSNPTSYNTQGTITEYFTASNINLFLKPTTDADCSITNISVKEVGQDWSLTGTWSVENNYATANANNTSQYLQQNFNITNGKKYLFSYEIIENTLNGNGSSLSNSGGFGSVAISNVIGTHQVYINATNSSATYALMIGVSSSATTGTIKVDNISLKEITDDTNIPRINYEGFSYQDTLGNEVNSDVNFDNPSSWSLTGQSTVSNGKAHIVQNDTSNTGVIANTTITNKTYKITGVVSDYVSGSVGFSSIGSTTPRELIPTQNGEFTIYYTSTRSAPSTWNIQRIVSPCNLKIDNVSVKEVTGQEVVPDSGCGSWLLEGQSTNLIEYSNFQSGWSVLSGGSITQNQSISPDGTQNAAILSGNGANPNAAYTSITVSIQEYTYSMFAKKGSEYILRMIGFSAGANGNVEFNLNDGTIETLSSGAFSNEKIEDYGNGWYRCSVKVTVTSSGSKLFGFNREAIVSGDLFSVYGTQLEQQSFPTSYIPTNGATNTRLQDIANNSGNSSLINSTEGTLYFEGSALVDNNDGSKSISISSGAYSNNIIMQYTTNTNQIVFKTSPSYSTPIFQSYNVSDITENSKIAFKYKLTIVRFGIMV